MNYHRYFIPLTPDSKGFEWGGKEPLGRCILEDRGKTGKLSLWVQDLKAETPYKIILILSDAGKYTGVTLGSLFVDGKGKAEFKTEFDTQNLADGQGLPRVCAVSVLTGGSELLCPLVGYKDGPVLWKNHFTLQGSENKERAKDTQRVMKKAETAQYPDTQTGVAAGITEVPVQRGVLEPDTADTQAAVAAGEDTDVLSAADADNSFRYYENEYNPYTDGMDYAEDLYQNSPDGMEHPNNETEYDPTPSAENGNPEALGFDSIRSLKEVFDSNIEITPFESKSAEEKWVRVSLREPVFLPVDYRYFMNHPFIIAAYRKYNHLIMGTITGKGKTQYVLGVPGVYEPQYVNAAHQLGFTQFKTIHDSEELHPNDYGYWLAPVYMLG